MVIDYGFSVEIDCLNESHEEVSQLTRAGSGSQLDHRLIERCQFVDDF